MQPSQIAIVLITSTPPNQEQEGNQRTLLSWMKAHNIDHKVVDGADETQKELRNELFAISNIRGKYPQVFLSNKSDTTKFIGDFYAVELLEENKDTPNVENVHTVFAGAINN